MTHRDPDPALSMGPAADERFRTLAVLAWVSYAIGLLTSWITGPIGWIIAVLKLGEARGTLYESHFAAIMRGGIVCFVGYALGWILVATLVGAVIGFPILVLVWLYNVYIVVRGLLRLSDGRPYA